MGNSALGRGTAIEENKVKASSGDVTPNFLDGKVGNSIKVVSNLLEVGVPSQILGDTLYFNGTNWVRQPSIAFQVFNSVAQTNIANTGADITIVLDSERFDNNGNFAANTFTAPISGYYNLSASVVLQQIDSAATGYHLVIKTSNRNYNYSIDPTVFTADSTNNITFAWSMVADMDAGDTAFLTFAQDGGTQQTDIPLQGAYFSGILVQPY